VRYLLIPSLLVVSSLATAQTHTISGYIRDAASEENLIGATALDLISEKGTAANNYGFYSLTLPGDSVVLGYSYVGYKSQTFRFLLSRDTVLIVKLEGATTLEEVVIESERAEKIHESSRMGTVNMPLEQVQRVPVFMGEADPLKVLQLLPGVQAGTEGSSGLYVRGGGPDQNLFLLDGVAVYNPNHMFGFFSAFNPDAINRIELIKGGFPARYGGRLSSIVDISMKEGNQQEFHAQGSIGLIAAKLSVEGPIIKGRTSFIFSARRSYPDPLKSQYLPRRPDNLSEDYYFYDLNLKLNHRINTKNRIYLSGYDGRDRVETSTEMDFLDTATNINTNYYDEASQAWGNSVAALRWNHEFTQRLFANVSFSFSRYELMNSTYSRFITTFPDVDTVHESYYDFTYQSNIQDWSIKLDFDYTPRPGHLIRFGAEAIDHSFAPGVIVQTSSYESSNRHERANSTRAQEFALYAEDDWELTNKFKANIGLRTTAFTTEGTTYYSLQPRFSARYRLSEQSSLKASYSRMQQCTQLLSNAGMGMPTDLWVPATSRVPPQTSSQVGVGYAQMFRNEYEFSMEGFYKTMNNLIEYKDGASYVNVRQDWQDKVETGRGESYGLELFVHKKVGKFSGWTGYTLSWTNRQFDNINDGEWFPYRYDRRHDLKITGLYQINKHLEAGAVWMFSTGNALTVPLESYWGAGRYDHDSDYVWVTAYEKRNGFRVRNYHRLDINFSYLFHIGKTENRLSFSAFNAYGRNNTYYIMIVDTHERGRAVLHKTLFGVMPSLSLSMKF
jgi:outer membrane receptor for ferrienterochelin and colicin